MVSAHEYDEAVQRYIRDIEDDLRKVSMSIRASARHMYGTSEADKPRCAPKQTTAPKLAGKSTMRTRF